MSTRGRRAPLRRTSGQAGPAAGPAVQTPGATRTPSAAGKTPGAKGKQPAKTSVTKDKPAKTSGSNLADGDIARALEQSTSFLGPGSLGSKEQEAIAALRAQQKKDELRSKNKLVFEEAARKAAEGGLLDSVSVQVLEGDGQISTGREARPPLPVGVGELIEAAPRVPDEQMERSINLVSQWNAVFTPSITPDEAITMELLRNQAAAFADGQLFMPPPLSVEGLALPVLLTTTGGLDVQQEVLQRIGRGRMELEERIAARLLQGEQCAAMGLAWNFSAMPAVMQKGLEAAFFSGYAPDKVLDILAEAIKDHGYLAAFNNPVGWLFTEIGQFMTDEAINTYLLIWLTNKLYGAK